MSIYAFHENATVATAVADADIFPFNKNGVIQSVTGKVLRTSNNGVVDTVATVLAVTQALHGNTTVTVSATSAIAITLPQATGTGTKYRFILQVAATATQHTLKVANATDCLQGVYCSPATSTATHIAFAAVSSATTATRSDTVTLNGTTTGGAQGCDIEVTDIATGFFQIQIMDTCVSTTTTPFSAGV